MAWDGMGSDGMAWDGMEMRPNKRAHIPVNRALANDVHDPNRRGHDNLHYPSPCVNEYNAHDP